MPPAAEVCIIGRWDLSASRAPTYSLLPLAATARPAHLFHWVRDGVEVGVEAAWTGVRGAPRTPRTPPSAAGRRYSRSSWLQRVGTNRVGLEPARTHTASSSRLLSPALTRLVVPPPRVVDCEKFILGPAAWRRGPVSSQRCDGILSQQLQLRRGPYRIALCNLCRFGLGSRSCLCHSASICFDVLSCYRCPGSCRTRMGGYGQPLQREQRAHVRQNPRLGCDPPGAHSAVLHPSIMAVTVCCASIVCAWARRTLPGPLVTPGGQQQVDFSVGQPPEEATHFCLIEAHPDYDLLCALGYLSNRA